MNVQINTWQKYPSEKCIFKNFFLYEVCLLGEKENVLILIDFVFHNVHSNPN